MPTKPVFLAAVFALASCGFVGDGDGLLDEEGNEENSLAEACENMREKCDTGMSVDDCVDSARQAPERDQPTSRQLDCISGADSCEEMGQCF
jgi:hypothetical protein